MTQAEKSSRSWPGERGGYRRRHANKTSARRVRPIYYLTGPAAMVTALRTFLSSVAVGSGDLKTEECGGY